MTSTGNARGDGLPAPIRRAALAGGLALLASATAAAQEPAAPETPEEQSLQERLTEREDETRVEDPFRVEWLGHPLLLRGQYEVILEDLSQIPLGGTAEPYGRRLLEQELELEAFYSRGPQLSFFLQPRLIRAEDLDSDTPDDVSDFFVERGEMWLNSGNLGGLPLMLEVGRLNFEDDRLWWWDTDLDAVRVTWEVEGFDVALAAARELFSDRSDRSYIDPEDNGVFRLLAEASLDWHPEHSLQLFAVSHADRSRTEQPGAVVDREREDDSDARLFWAGLRASGAHAFEEIGGLGYWLDVGRVVGEEDLLEIEPISPDDSEVETRQSRNVRGWGFDLGATGVLPVELEPRITFGFAHGSGDRTPDDGSDCAYRQTGLQGNEPGYGGVQRFKGYGLLLEPELSNLAIFTAGAGCSLLESSSLDLVFHDYRLVERADSLRDSRLDAELTGTDRDLGQGLDLILAIEESTRVEFEVAVSTFRAGRAFGHDADRWLFAGFFAVRVAF